MFPEVDRVRSSTRTSTGSSRTSSTTTACSPCRSMHSCVESQGTGDASSTPASGSRRWPACEAMSHLERSGSSRTSPLPASRPRTSTSCCAPTCTSTTWAGTRALVDGKWVPTFPNARYLFARVEYEHWDGGATRLRRDVRRRRAAGLRSRSRRPGRHGPRVTDEVWFEPTPGHSPGHVAVRIASAGSTAGHHRRHDAPPGAVRRSALGDERRRRSCDWRRQPRASISAGATQTPACASSARTSVVPPPASSRARATLPLLGLAGEGHRRG